MSKVQVWCQKRYSQTNFTEDFRNGPLSPEIRTGAVLCTVRMNEMPRFYVAKLLLHHYTVSMKSLTIISGQMHLLHQFKSDFAHLLALGNLVIELPNAKK